MVADLTLGVAARGMIDRPLVSAFAVPGRRFDRLRKHSRDAATSARNAVIVTNAGAMNHTIRRLTTALADGYRIERELAPDRFPKEVRSGMAGVGGSGR